MKSIVAVLIALTSWANAQSLEGIARCVNGAGVANVPVCVGETVTCTVTWNNIDTQNWTVNLLTVTALHPSGAEGGDNLLTTAVTLPPGAGVSEAGVFVARAEDIPTLTVGFEADATAPNGFGQFTPQVLVDVMTCATPELRAEKRAYRARRYRVQCTDEDSLRVCHNGTVFTAPLQ